MKRYDAHYSFTSFLIDALMKLFVHIQGAGIGGAETSLFNLLFGLKDRRFQIFLSCSPGPVRRYLSTLPINFIDEERNVDAWTRQLRIVNPDVVYVVGLSQAIAIGAAARRLAIPTVWHATERPASFFAGDLRKTLLSVFDDIFVPSDYLRTLFGFPRADVVANGIDPVALRSRFGAREELRKALGISDDTFLLGYSARLIPLKRHRELLAAASRLAGEFPKLHLLLLGRREGTGYASFAQSLWEIGECAPLRHRLHWVAAFPEAVPEFLSTMDGFAFPSEGEGLPCALIEAMAMGLPSVVVSGGGAGEIVGNSGSGLTFAHGDSQGLVTQLRRLLADEPLRCELSAQARENVENRFTVDKMVERCAELFARTRLRLPLSGENRSLHHHTGV